MKIPVLVLLAMAGSLPALAQENRVSIGLGTLTHSTLQLNDVAERTHRHVSDRYALPTIGYYRMLSGKTGIGVELGYGRGRRTVTQSSPAWHPNVPTTAYLDEQVEVDEIHVSPTLFTLVTTNNRRFRFTPGISLPVSYMLRSSATSAWLATRDEDGFVLGRNRSTSPEQKSFSVGLMLGGSALCRIAGNLYAGLQLGAGFRYHKTSTEGEQIEIQNEGMPIESQHSIKVRAMDEGLNFQFQPAVVANYFF